MATADQQTFGALNANFGRLLDIYSASMRNLQTLVAAAAAGGATTYATRGDLYADVAADNGAIAVVFQDTTAGFNGLYVKSGASGVGGWVFTGLLLSADAHLANVAPDVLAWLSGLPFAGSVNLADTTKFTAGYAVPANGGVYQQPGYNLSPLISVRRGGPYFCNHATVFAWFDADGGPTGEGQVYATGASVTAPDDAFYTRFHAVDGQLATTMLMQIEPPAGYVPYGEEAGVSQGVALEIDAINATLAGTLALIRDVPVSPETNLIGANLFTHDTAVASNGSVYGQPGYSASAPIRVFEGATYYCTDGLAYALYADLTSATGAQGDSAVGGGGVAARTGLTVPAGVAFIRFHVASAAVPTVMLMRVVPPVGAYAPYGETTYGHGADADLALALTIRETVDRSLALDRNLFDPARVILDKALAGAPGSGGGAYDATGWVTSDFVEVTPGGVINCNVAYQFAFYSSAQEGGASFISGGPLSGGNQVAAGTPTPVPAGAYYARIDFNGFVNLPLAYVGGVATLPPFKPFGGGGGYLPYSGANTVVLGDSFTADQQWVDAVKSACALNVTLVDGVPGRSFGAYTGSHTAAQFAGASLVLMQGGTNNFGGGDALGIITEAAAPTGSFVAKLKHDIETVQNWNPAVRILLIGPIQRLDGTVNGTGATLLQFVDMMIAVGALYAIPVFDAYRNSGINALNATYYLRDNLHPKYNIGYPFYARPISSFVNAH